MLLYIHIPFCASKCGYCGFNSLTNMLDFKRQYLEALKNDLITSLPFGEKFSSVYIGGGTPNMLNPSDYEEIFSILQGRIEQDAEITIELNPNALQASILREFSDLGINRFSIGVQSFNERKLQLLEREHSPKIAYKFIENALKCGVSVSIDLIYDTLLDSKDLLESELENAASLGTGHISCYTISLDKNSAFFRKNKNIMRDSSLCYALKEILAKHNFTQYEVSNFAKTHKSKHNLGYWAYSDYIGVGLGAVGKTTSENGIYRAYKSGDFKAYLSNPNAVKKEFLSENDIILEKIFLGLRSEIGVEKSLIRNAERLKILLENGKVLQKNGLIYATNYFLADEIALWL